MKKKLSDFDIRYSDTINEHKEEMEHECIPVIISGDISHKRRGRKSLECEPIGLPCLLAHQMMIEEILDSPYDKENIDCFSYEERSEHSPMQELSGFMLDNRCDNEKSLVIASGSAEGSDPANKSGYQI